MDCKKVLEETNGDLDAAVKSLRKKACSMQVDRSTKEGRVITSINNNVAVILELNCETDFVANNENFIQLGKPLQMSLPLHKQRMK